MELRYGLNPEHTARVIFKDGAVPLRLVSGEPSYINILDALGAWRLVREARAALSTPVATTFKHLSPAGAATAAEVDEVMAECWVPSGVVPSEAATAYIRARDCDPKSSFGDFIAISEPVDRSLGEVLRRVVSDGIIAPGYAEDALEILRAKKGGRYVVLEVDPSFEPPALEASELFGLRLEQFGSPTPITEALIRAGTDQQLPSSAVADLVLAVIVARYTQSNSVTYARRGMALGIGAGQQSRVDCTKLAGGKADIWWLRRHPMVRALPFRGDLRLQDRLNWEIRYIEADMEPAELARFHAALMEPAAPFLPEVKAEWVAQLDGVALASDGFIPFRDNIDVAARHGVRYIADPGGSTRNADVKDACDQHGIVLVTTGVRLFRH